MSRFYSSLARPQPRPEGLLVFQERRKGKKERKFLSFSLRDRRKKGRGEKIDKREKGRRSSLSLHSGGEKRVKRVFLSSQSPSHFTSPFALFDACHTGYGVRSMEQNSVWGGKRRESRLIAHRKLFSGRARWAVNEYLRTYLITQSDGK